MGAGKAFGLTGLMFIIFGLEVYVALYAFASLDPSDYHSLALIGIMLGGWFALSGVIFIVMGAIYYLWKSLKT